MAVHVNWDVSESCGSRTFTFDELNVSSQDEWDGMSKEDQKTRLQEALDSMSEQPYMVVDDWS